MTRILALLMILTLAACGSQKGTLSLAGLKGAATRLTKGTPPPVDFRKLLTRAEIDNLQVPAVFTELEDSGLNSGMLLQARNGQVLRFGAGASSAIAYKNGIVVRTHGLGHDLISADVEGLERALRQGGSSNAVRIHRYLGGDNKEITRSYVCDVRFEGRESIIIFEIGRTLTRVSESCQNVDTSFENLYWVGAGGKIWRSKSWISPEMGALLTDDLAR